MKSACDICMQKKTSKGPWNVFSLECQRRNNFLSLRAGLISCFLPGQLLLTFHAGNMTLRTNMVWECLQEEHMEVTIIVGSTNTEDFGMSSRGTKILNTAWSALVVGVGMGLRFPVVAFLQNAPSCCCVLRSPAQINCCIFKINVNEKRRILEITHCSAQKLFLLMKGMILKFFRVRESKVPGASLQRPMKSTGTKHGNF